MDKDLNKIHTLMRQLFGLVHRLEDEAIKASEFSDLSRAEISAIMAIGTGRPKTMTHVANILEINVSTLTTTINKLVKKGYVERLRDDKDRRIVKIGLSEKGIAAATERDSFMGELLRGAVEQVEPDKLRYFISAIDNINQYFMAKSSMSYLKTTPFALEPLQLGKRDLPVPIVQAGMSLGIAGPKLASAVAEEGGLGLIGASDIGWQREDFARDRMEANVKALQEKVAEALKRRKKRSGKGLIGVSVLWGNPAAREYVKAAAKSGAEVIVASGLPTDLPKYCTDKNIALIPVVSSRRGAAAIVRNWTQKYNRVPDAFILQGPFAAGLLGFKEEQLDRAEQEWGRIISDVKSEASKLENCPLLVGGGIYRREDAEFVYKYGADGILMGTRFVVTEECDAPDGYKQLYLNCRKNDVTIIRSPMKTSVRTMRTAFSEKIAEDGDEPYDLFEAVRRSVAGDPDSGLVFCSENAGLADKIDTVKDVFREFTTQKK